MSYRILVVDDFADAANVIATLFRALGHECRTAMTGTEALQVLDEFVPDIAVIDIGLPDMNGLELASVIRERGRGRRPMIAALSGYGSPDHRVQALAAGCDHHVLKPIDGAIVKRLLVLADRHFHPATERPAADHSSRSR